MSAEAKDPHDPVHARQRPGPAYVDRIVARADRDAPVSEQSAVARVRSCLSNVGATRDTALPLGRNSAAAVWWRSRPAASVAPRMTPHSVASSPHLRQMDIALLAPAARPTSCSR
jgi:hypothetical protein